ncbi:unnamed protein product [Owenia fusiformis]|uniref:Follistatin-related protein 5 n=1 Tax=Owenia fusiformis TaxID=6347 RepID=A0A8S4PR69_OWEFU|nr:unnamed protein product [Owenia fusiformis]
MGSWRSSGIILFCCSTLLLEVIAKPYTFKKHHKKPEQFFESSYHDPFDADNAIEDDDHLSEDVLSDNGKIIAKDAKDGKWMSWLPEETEVNGFKDTPADDTNLKARESDPMSEVKDVSEFKDVSDENNASEADDDLDGMEEDEASHEGLNDNEVDESEEYEEDPCATVWCHEGRVCQASSGGAECVCAPEGYCQGHAKKVCGSDGQIYPSHCELHRMACVTRKHIGIDRKGKGCQSIKDKNTKKSKDDKKKSSKKDKKQKKDKKSKKQNKIEIEFKQIKPQPTTTEPTELIVETDFPPCSITPMNEFLVSLLQYHCERVGEENCNYGGHSKQFLVNIIFNYYDLDGNEKVDKVELYNIEHRNHLERLSQLCQLPDMLTFFDTMEPKGAISIDEMYKAFNVSRVHLNDKLKTFKVSTAVGKSIELKCAIEGANRIMWKRHSVDLQELSTKDITVFGDGSLFLSPVGLHHMGNFTCQDPDDHDVVQTHVIKVSMPPKAKVSYSSQYHVNGEDVVLKCHADGIPTPHVEWQVNETPLADDPKHYQYFKNNQTLEVIRATFTKDTGAYKCKANNEVGEDQDITTVFVENSEVPQASPINSEVFVVFHDGGYNVYDPQRCNAQHYITGSYSNFKLLHDDPVESLCQQGEPCSWGEAVNVLNKYIYISQPDLNRVIIIDIKDRFNPIQVIPTDKIPVAVHYVEHLDQVWILCWNNKDYGGVKTALVIQKASADGQHHTIHTEPVANRFDQIEDIFVPGNNDLSHQFSHGYVVHHEQQALFKIDLETMKYVRTIDLKKYECVPHKVEYAPLGGNILVQCNSPMEFVEPKPKLLILDYITDKVIGLYPRLAGEPFATPDGRYIINVDKNSVTVYSVDDEGNLKHSFDEYTGVHVSDVAFFPSDSGKSYDFYASSTDKNDVMYINLATGRVELIEGVGQGMESKDWPWSKKNRRITSGGVFGDYLITPSKNSIVVIDGRLRHVQCEWNDIIHGNVVVWVDPYHL